MEEIKEKNFFKKVWTSIKDFEGYEEFAASKISRVIKYIILLTLIFTAIVSCAYTVKFYLAVENVKNYINENVENITLKNGKLDISSKNDIIIEDENGIIPIIIVDTNENANTSKYLEKLKAYDIGMLLLSDRIVISNSLLNIQNTNVQDVNQNNSESLINNSKNSLLYTNLIDFDINSKEDMIKLLSGQTIFYMCIIFFTTMLIYLLIIYFTSNLIDGVVLGILGYLFARIVKLRLRYKATFNIGIHALTLPLILNLIYMIVNMFTGFTINYFQWMYTTISYIYVAVAILMIKTEIINQRIQLIKLQEIQEKVAKEAEEKLQTEEKKEDKGEENKKDKDKEETDGEPEGSNA